MLERWVEPRQGQSLDHVCYPIELKSSLFPFSTLLSLSLSLKLFQIAVESIENVHTVAALAAEDSFFHKYSEQLQQPYK